MNMYNNALEFHSHRVTDLTATTAAVAFINTYSLILLFFFINYFIVSRF